MEEGLEGCWEGLENVIQDTRSFLRERVGSDLLIFADFAVMQRSLDTVVEQKADELSTVGFTDAGVSFYPQTHA